MPYIKQSQREKFPEELLNEIARLMRLVMNIPTYVGSPRLHEGAEAIRVLICNYDREVNTSFLTGGSDRELLFKNIMELASKVDTGLTSYAGELNYLITTILLRVYKITPTTKLRYFEWNDIVGVLRNVELSIANDHYSPHPERITVLGMLECCKMELYRRHVAPYEDEKIIENGDV